MKNKNQEKESVEKSPKKLNKKTKKSPNKEKMEKKSVGKQKLSNNKIKSYDGESEEEDDSSLRSEKN